MVCEQQSELKSAFIERDKVEHATPAMPTYHTLANHSSKHPNKNSETLLSLSIALLIIPRIRYAAALT
jgi:hypothetical protein